MARVTNLGGQVRTTIDRKREQRAAVQRHAVQLRPGLWRLTAARGARHLRQAEPLILRHSAHGSRSSRTANMASRLLGVGLSLVPPWVTLVRASASQGHPADVLGKKPVMRATIVVPSGSDTILLDPPRSVVRVLGAPVDALYADTRRALARHVPAPPFEVLDDGATVREDFVSGRPISHLVRSVRFELVQQVLDSYVTLVRAEQRGDSRDFMAAAFARLYQYARVPDEVLQAIERREDAIVAAAAGWPMTPSHGDLSPVNVVRSDDGFSLLDLQSVGDRPFFYDPLHLAIRMRLLDDAQDLVSFVHERFASEVFALYASAGVTLDDDALRNAGLATLVAYGSELRDGITDPTRSRFPTLWRLGQGGASEGELLRVLGC